MHQNWDLLRKSSAWTVPSPVVRPFPARRHDAAALAPQAHQGISECRGCGRQLKAVILDLGSQPSLERPRSSETIWPLRVAHCAKCHLVQLIEGRPDILGETVSARSRGNQDIDSLVKGLKLNEKSLVVDVASGIGETLREFQERGIRVLGLEPDRIKVRAAAEKAVPTRACGFDVFSARRLVKDGMSADLLIVHDVLARAPRPDSMLDAVRRMLKPNGIVLIETPHLLNIVQETRIDAFRHEQRAYYSLIALESLLAAHGLRAIHAMPARGAGMLRVYACRIESTLVQSDTVAKMTAREREAGLDQAKTFAEFGERALAVLERLRNFVEGLRKDRKTIVAYGASSDGDALLSYCGAHQDTIAYIADPDPAKQGTRMAGSGIVVMTPEHIRTSKPDFLLVLPGWPVQDVVRQHSYIQRWGGRFGCLALR